MQFGRLTHISENTIQDILDTMRFFSIDELDLASIRHLFVVERNLVDPKSPRSDKHILYILHNIFTDIIVSELEQLRARFGINTVLGEKYTQAVDSILIDSQSQSVELASWSILYYLYIEVDLGFTVQSLADIVGMTPRTLRRYKTYSVQLLTYQLWEMEKFYRQEHHEKHIRKQLAPFNNKSWIGREDELNLIINSVTNHESEIIYIHGEKGVGKTAFIKKAILLLLNHLTIDDILWINNANSILFQVKEHFHIDDEKISLESLFSILNCIIVLDNADNLLKYGEIDKLLPELKGAIVFFTSRFYYTIATKVVHLQLHNFDADDTQKLVSHICSEKLSASDKNSICTLSEGNPAYIHQLTNYYRYTSRRISEAEKSLLSGLKNDQRLFLSLLPSRYGIGEQDFYLLADIVSLNSQEVQFLFDTNCILRIEDRFYCEIEANRIAEFTLELSEILRLYVDKLSELNESSIIAMHILENYRQHCNKFIESSLVYLFWRKGLTSRGKSDWLLLLRAMPDTDETWLLLAKAVSYRQLNELNLAENMLWEAIQQCGIDGDFAMQAEAVLELIKVYRLSGKYEHATRYMNILNDTLQRYLSAEGLNTFILEKAQVALDMNQAHYAIALSNTLDTDEAILVKAEALYQLGEVEQCINTCDLLLYRLSLSDDIRGIVHNLVARCHQSLNLNLSIDHYNIAIEYFRKNFDIRSLGRTKINLTTCFIGLGRLDDAVHTLQQASGICTITQDAVALQTIEKNRMYIHNLRVLQHLT